MGPLSCENMLEMGPKVNPPKDTPPFANQSGLEVKLRIGNSQCARGSTRKWDGSALDDFEGSKKKEIAIITRLSRDSKRNCNYDQIL